MIARTHRNQAAALGLLIAVFVTVLSATSRSARADDSGPWVPIDFKQGVSFNHPDRMFDLVMRIRAQNLLQYESAYTGQPSLVTAQVRRLRMRFGGWMINERLRFNLQLSFSRNDQDWDGSGVPNVVRDASVIYAVTDRLSLSFGQSKLPGNRQRIASSGEQQLVDRSIVNRAFNLDRDFGVQARYQFGHEEHSHFALIGSLSSGGGRNANARRAAYLARIAKIEFLPLGSFKNNGDYSESDLAFEETPKTSFAAYWAEFKGIQRAGGTILNEFSDPSQIRGFQTFGIDTVTKYRGWSLSGEYIRKQMSGAAITATSFKSTPSSTTLPIAGTGYLAQVGYLFRQNWEIAGRWAVVDSKSGLTVSRIDRQTQWTLGTNHFLNGHRMKIQMDATRSLTRATTPANSYSQWIGRFQVELGI